MLTKYQRTSRVVTDILQEQTGLDRNEIKPKSKLIHDLGLDSLDAMETVMAVEEELDIAIPDKELGYDMTQDDLTRVAESRVEDGALNDYETKHSRKPYTHQTPEEINRILTGMNN